MIVTRIRAGAAGLLLLTTLAACSGGAVPSGVATLQSPGTDDAASPRSSAAPSASLDPEDAQLAFARCMRDKGIDMPDPVAGGGMVAIDAGKTDPKEVQAAFETCGKLLGTAGGASTPIDPEMQDKMLKFAGCMRDHGVDFHDPVVGGGGVTMQVGGAAGAIDPSSTDFQDATEACQPILGDLPGVVPGGGGAGPGIVVAPGGAQPAPVAP